ncbi:MAG TPA: hypothetical protein VNT30_09925 [Stellaceae bacterium]|nr:hypothetical protein [Stellaceae bacterium]
MRPTAYSASLAGGRAMAGQPFFETIPAEFNQLLIFDDRIPHAVRQITGGMDPREGRVVLHGHFTGAK